jgi:hypothetical protein
MVQAGVVCLVQEPILFLSFLSTSIYMLSSINHWWQQDFGFCFEVVVIC